MERGKRIDIYLIYSDFGGSLYFVENDINRELVNIKNLFLVKSL